MKITRIQAQNVLGLQDVDARLPTPVALFAGRNGSGKSSIQEAVRMAITQKRPTACWCTKARQPAAPW